MGQAFVFHGSIVVPLTCTAYHCSTSPIVILSEAKNLIFHKQTVGVELDASYLSMTRGFSISTLSNHQITKLR